MSKIDTCPQELIDLGHRLCDAVRSHIERYFRSQFDVEQKTDGSPVTEADRGAEKIIRGILEKERPDDSVFGEEFGEKEGTSGWRWVLDPVDGTKAFVAGKATFGTLIGLMYHDQFVMGFCDQSITKDRWVGAKGHPSTWNGKTISVRKNQPIGKWVTSCVNPFRFSDDIQEILKKIHVQGNFMSMGGDCLNFCLMASGRIDIVLETNQELYDIAALVPIIEGAGGHLLKFENGKPYTAGYTKAVVAVSDKTSLDFLKKLN